MKSVIKKVILALLITLNIGLFFNGGLVYAQIQPPTLLPATDADIGGRSGECIGLATMIRTGDIHLRNLPCFIKFFTQTLIGLSGSLAVVFVMLGGYRWVIGSDQDKETAKKTITYALIGLVITLMAWVIVSLVLQVSTE